MKDGKVLIAAFVLAAVSLASHGVRALENGDPDFWDLGDYSPPMPADVRMASLAVDFQADGVRIVKSLSTPFDSRAVTRQSAALGFFTSKSGGLILFLR